VKSRLTRLAVVSAATVGLMAASPSPAMANTNITLRNSADGAVRGHMTFHDDGDVFEVCDTRADGHGFVGYLVFKPWLGDEYLRVIKVTDGGDSGCDKRGWNVGNDGNYHMELYWSGSIYGAHSESRQFNE
jgi:hypothetical protein